MKQPEMYWPTSAWRTLAPQAFGLQPELFAPLHDAAQEDERIHSMLVIRSGYIVFEEYYHGWSQNHYHNVNSVTKNITSLLVGMALRDKKIETLNQSIFSFFPEYASPGEQEKRNALSLHHLLSLTSGFAFSGYLDTFLEHTATLEGMLRRPVAHEPGTVFSYDDLDIHLIALILTRVAGMSLADFAQQSLFDPLGIWYDEQGHLYPWKYGTAREDTPHPYGLKNEQSAQLWSVDRQGHQIGGFGLQLTPREMAKVGYLYLRQGQWDGQQLVPAEYVQASLRAYSSTPRGYGYGYCWYLTRPPAPRSFRAIGFGGQLIICIPDLDLIFVMTARPDEDQPPPHSKIIPQVFDPFIGKILLIP